MKNFSNIYRKLVIETKKKSVVAYYRGKQSLAAQHYQRERRGRDLQDINLFQERMKRDLRGDLRELRDV